MISSSTSSLTPEVSRPYGGLVARIRRPWRLLSDESGWRDQALLLALTVVFAGPLIALARQLPVPFIGGHGNGLVADLRSGWSIAAVCAGAHWIAVARSPRAPDQS
jgi:hypothetical protein